MSIMSGHLDTERMKHFLHGFFETLQSSHVAISGCFFRWFSKLRAIL